MYQHQSNRKRSFVIFCIIAIVVTSRVYDSGADTNQAPNDQAQQGEMFMSQGRWEEAIHTFTVALRTAPNNAALHSNLGMAYYFHGDSASAIPELQTAVHLDH